MTDFQASATKSVVAFYQDLSKLLALALNHEETRCDYLSKQVFGITLKLNPAYKIYSYVAVRCKNVFLVNENKLPITCFRIYLPLGKLLELPYSVY